MVHRQQVWLASRSLYLCVLSTSVIDRYRQYWAGSKKVKVWTTATVLLMWLKSTQISPTHWHKKNNNTWSHFSWVVYLEGTPLAAPCTLWSNWHLHIIDAGSRSVGTFPVTAVDWQPPRSCSYLQCIQVAQLLQRDCAAVWVSCGPNINIVFRIQRTLL